jgi:hypothetical protein
MSGTSFAVPFVKGAAPPQNSRAKPRRPVVSSLASGKSIIAPDIEAAYYEK